MKDYKYTYELENDEYIEYLQYLVNRVPKNRMIRFWINLSVPALAIFTVVFFRLYTSIITIGVAVIVVFFWLAVGGSFVWRQLMALRVDTKFLSAITVEQFATVKTSFGKTIIVNGKHINYQDVLNIIPLRKSLVFFYGNSEAFILPLRVVGDKEAIRQLCRDVMVRMDEPLP